MLMLPVLAFAHLLLLPHGDLGQVTLFDLALTTTRVDRLSLLFGYVFLIAALLGVVYALHVRDTVQQVAALIYAGSALGAVFAGDLVTLFVFWEGIAVASVFLIWAARNEQAYGAGMRYLIVHIGSGALLLAGVLVHYNQTGSLAFGSLGLGSAGTTLIFLAFGIKCAFPLLHNWLQDAYPEATVTGTVFLSGFTTKVAVYALARGFAGTEILVPIGAAMTAFPIFYAVIENDLRRVLAYSLNNQLGFMVVGIGIGTLARPKRRRCACVRRHPFQEPALHVDGSGAVSGRHGQRFRVGRTLQVHALDHRLLHGGGGFDFRLSALQRIRDQVDGDHRSHGRRLLLDVDRAAVRQRRRLPPRRHQDPLLCLLRPRLRQAVPGSSRQHADRDGDHRGAMHRHRHVPGDLLRTLPFQSDYRPYSLDHVVAQIQLLLLSALAFTLLMRTGIYPPELRSTNLDFDWFYRRLGFDLAKGLNDRAGRAWQRLVGAVGASARRVNDKLQRHHGPEGVLGRTWPTGTMAFWTTVMLAAYLILSNL